MKTRRCTAGDNGNAKHVHIRQKDFKSVVIKNVEKKNSFKNLKDHGICQWVQTFLACGPHWLHNVSELSKLFSLFCSFAVLNR